MKSAKQLRPYQVRLVTDVCRTTEDVLVEQPTGSGKTVQIVTLIAMHLGHRFTHAVVSAPQEQIEEGFVKRDYQVVAFPDCPGVAVPPIQVPRSLIKGARESRLGSVKRIIHYLRQPGPLDHAFACTHAVLNRLTPDDLPADLCGKALFIDEAHHASADGLGQIVALWRERGGQLFFFTATPYRGDGRPVKLDGMRSFRRSLAEHMAEGFAPRHLESEIVALGQPGDAITAAQFTGEEAPPGSYFEGLVAAICRRWLDDGQPKAIVRVPPMQGGKSGELVGRLMQALAAHGARVLDATGTGAQDKQRFLAALEAEKNRTHATSAFDVMVGIQRVLEGTDWPVCSAVYCVGMPGSLNTVVQFLGRAMRPKADDYPAPHRDRARLVFFVPCAGGAALADLSIDHSRHALLTCCFLADHEVGQEWIVLREVRRGIEAALGDPNENPAAADAENEADEAIDPDVRAEIELAIAVARERILADGGEPTLGEIVQLAAKNRPDLPTPCLHRLATEIVAAQAGRTGTKARDMIHREVAKCLRIQPGVRGAMQEGFRAVLAEFRTATLEQSPVLQSVGRQIHGVTGGQMLQFAQRLRQAAPRPLTEEEILRWADADYGRTGEWPAQDSGPILDAPGETWVNIDAALRIGLRELPGGSSLAQLLADKRARRNHLALPPLTVEQILAWADAHHQRTGRWPKIKSGPIADAPGETWNAVAVALQTGCRGLPGGVSLPDLLKRERGVRHHYNLPVLTEEQILRWADAQRKQTGKWPTTKSGPILDTPDETWSSVQTALSAGGRGLPGGSSLARLLGEKRGVRNHLDLERLTNQQLLTWADAHFARTGQWPKASSGPIAEAPEETWRKVDRALIQGLRGLCGGSSLSKLLAEHRGARNHMDLPALSVEQILTWADAHFRRTGNWPRQDSGPVVDAPDVTWAAITLALRKGLRGLPGGSSLAGLLAEQRNARNHLALARLSEEQILAWADAYHSRTGQWPHHKSGDIEGALGETWARVNGALDRGLRGLSGGSSLAQLLAKKRNVRVSAGLHPLSVAQITAWADCHHERTGEWPKRRSGPVDNAPGETWASVDTALRRGRRGLSSSSSLSKLLAEHRGVTNIKCLPRLSVAHILAWADAHYQRTHTWPTANSGRIANAPGETWQRVDGALLNGRRGLTGRSSLAQLLAQHRGAENYTNIPALTERDILEWANSFHERTGRWPSTSSGTVPQVPREKWANIDQSLRVGLRGLPGGSSLAQLIKSRRLSQTV